MSMVAERAQCTANEKKHMQIENTPAKKQQHLNQFDNTCTANAHDTTKTEKLCK